MKFSHLTLAGALLGGMATQVAPAAAQRAVSYVPNEILVQTTAQSRSAMHRFEAQSGATVVRSFPNVGWSRIKLPAGTSVAQAVAQYKAMPGVVAAEPNYRYHLDKTSNDTLTNQLYGLEKIKAAQAWDVTTGKSDIVVAVLDTGIKYDHPDLAPNMWRNVREIAGNGKDDDSNGIIDDVYGYDSYNGDGNPMDDNGHGTHCAGVIGAVGNNNLGVVGVNWNIKLMALKNFGAEGSAASDAVAAYEYAIAMKKRGVNLRVISNSWGGPAESLAVRSIMKEATQHGIISICSAGNEGKDNDRHPSYPANSDVPGLVSVAASDDEDQPALFTNYGRNSADLAAPGVDILSTYIGKGPSTTDGSYAYLSGTSMACPYVSGAAALLLAQAPNLGVAEVKNRLMQAVDLLPQWRQRTASRGRLNLAKLLTTNTYGINGRLLTKDGQPLAGASIFIGNSTVPTAQSQRNGNYSITGLAPGSYSVTAKLAGWQFDPTPARINIVAGTPYSVRRDFTGTTSEAVFSITGSVYTLNGKVKTPIEGAQIFLNSKTQPITVTNSRGQYTITNRTAGTYYLSAQYGNLNIKSADRDNAVAIVRLPLNAAAKKTVDFVAATTDKTLPSLTIRAPLFYSSYGPNELTRAFGTASDESGIVSMYFYLYRYSDNEISYYLWESRTWSEPNRPVPIDALFLHQPHNSTSVNWSVPFPTLEVGNYYMAAFAYDSFRNYSVRGAAFDIEQKQEQSGAPTVAITNPTTGQQVVAGTSVTVRGNASDDQGMASVYLYLRRLDERNDIMGYYDWASKTWIEDNDNFNVYRVLPGRQNKTVNWSQVLPQLAPGNYEVGAFGRDIFGNEPAEDGSQDAVTSFEVVESAKPASPSPASSAGKS